MAGKFCLCVSQPPEVDRTYGTPFSTQAPSHQAGLPKGAFAVASAQVVLRSIGRNTLPASPQDEIVSGGFALSSAASCGLSFRAPRSESSL